MGAVANIDAGTLRKSVGAIHVIAQHTFLERKIFNYLLGNALPELKTTTRHRISVLELARGVGTQTNNLSVIKDAILGLMTKPVQWNVLDDGDEEWAATTGLASAKVVRGVCTYEYSAMLAEKLADPKIYALIDLNLQRNFTGRYSLVIYENCQRFVSVGSTGWWDLDHFRNIAYATSETLKNFKYLRRDVIDSAVKEINAVSDIEISPEYKRVGRGVAFIRFKVKANRRGRLLLGEPTEEQRSKAAYLDLTGLGLSDKAALKVMEIYDEAYLLEKITLTRRLVGEGKVNDSGAYLAAAIRDDYALVPEVEIDQEAVARIEARRAGQQEQDQAVEDLIAKEKKQRRLIVNAIEGALSLMSDDERLEAQEAFSKTLTPMHRNLFESQGFGLLPIERLRGLAERLGV